MNTIQFANLEELFDCYGRGNLVAIDNIKQLLFYTKNGCQPKFVYEHEQKPGKITGWFLKNETNWVYKKWMESAPRKNK